MTTWEEQRKHLEEWCASMREAGEELITRNAVLGALARIDEAERDAARERVKDIADDLLGLQSADESTFALLDAVSKRAHERRREESRTSARAERFRAALVEAQGRLIDLDDRAFRMSTSVQIANLLLGITAALAQDATPEGQAEKDSA